MVVLLALSFVTAGSFRIIQVCLKNLKEMLDSFDKNAFDFRCLIRVETLPIYFQKYSDLRVVSFLLPMETHDDTDSDLCSF